MESRRDARPSCTLEVVFVTKTEGVLIADAEAFLARRMTAHLSSGSSDLLTAFSAWALPDTGGTDTALISQRVATHSGAERDYRDVAVLGFINAIAPLAEREADALTRLLRWVSQCSLEIDGTPVGISTDATAMLGIAIAAAAAEPSLRACVADWIKRAAAKASQMPGLDTWKRGLITLSERFVSSGVVDVKDLGHLAPDVLLVCRAKGIVHLDDDQREMCELSVLDSARSLDDTLEFARSAFQFAALRTILTAPRTLRPERATIEDVVRILKGLEGSFRRWTWEEKAKTKRAPARQWHVDNEYHLQNILWVVLYPIFPDLRDEEYLPSSGQLQPRSDLCIPHLGVVIEAKFMYPNSTPQQMIEEISADVGLYLKPGSGFTSLIPVIWDDRSCTEDYPLLVRGLNEIRGVADTIIIARPGKMAPVA